MISIPDNLYQDLLEFLAESNSSELLDKLESVNFSMTDEFGELTDDMMEEMINAGIDILKFDKRLTAFQDQLESVEKVLDNLPSNPDKDPSILADKLSWAKLEVYK